MRAGWTPELLCERAMRDGEVRYRMNLTRIDHAFGHDGMLQDHECLLSTKGWRLRVRI